MLSVVSLAVGRVTAWRAATDGGGLSHFLADNGLLDGDLLGELLQGVFPFELVELGGGVLVEELVDGEEAAADTDVYLVLLDSDPHSLRSELIDSLALTHEHDLQLLSLRVVVDELSQALVDGVVLHWDVHCDALLQLYYVVLKCFNSTSASLSCLRSSSEVLLAL